MGTELGISEVVEALNGIKVAIYYLGFMILGVTGSIIAKR